MMPLSFIPRTLLRLPNAQRCIPTALRNTASRPRAFSRSAIALAGDAAQVEPPHSTLNDFLAQKKVIWPTKIDAGPATFHAKTTVKGRSGIRDIRIRDHRIISDSPDSFAGYDLGPMSAEILLAGLSSCVAHVYLIAAATMDIPLTTLEVEAHGTVDLRGGQPGYDAFKPGVDGISYDVYVSSTAPKETVEALHAQVERVCPVLNTFTRPNRVQSRLFFASQADIDKGDRLDAFELLR